MGGKARIFRKCKNGEEDLREEGGAGAGGCGMLGNMSWMSGIEATVALRSRNLFPSVFVMDGTRAGGGFAGRLGADKEGLWNG